MRCRGGDSCGPTGVSTRCARPPHALRPCRVTRRPSLRSESSYGPCGPGWTGASRPSTASRRMRDEQSTGGLGRARSRGAVEAANAGAFGLRRHRTTAIPHPHLFQETPIMSGWSYWPVLGVHRGKRRGAERSRVDTKVMSVTQSRFGASASRRPRLGAARSSKSSSFWEPLTEPRAVPPSLEVSTPRRGSPSVLSASAGCPEQLHRPRAPLGAHVQARVPAPSSAATEDAPTAMRE